MRKADPRTYFPDCSGNNSASTNKLTSAKLNDVAAFQHHMGLGVDVQMRST